MRQATPYVHPLITLAAVNSSGVRTTAGNSAACVGRVRVMLNVATGANVKTTHPGAPHSMAAATAPMLTTCPTMPMMRTR